MEKLELPFELVFYIDQEQSCKILPDISTPNLIELYKKEEDWRVRRAMAPELSKRSDISTPNLIELYKKEEDVDVRRAMAPELSKRLAELVRERNFKVVF